MLLRFALQLLLSAVCTSGLPGGRPNTGIWTSTLPGNVSETLTVVALNLFFHCIQLLHLHITEVNWFGEVFGGGCGGGGQHSRDLEEEM